MTLAVSPLNSGKRYEVTIMGLVPTRHCLMVSAPATVDGSLIALARDSQLTCEWVSPTAIFKFDANIANLLFQPVPIVVLNQLQRVKRRSQRNQARALTALAASIRTPERHPALVTDLGMGGARIAIEEPFPTLEVGAPIELALRAQLFRQRFVITLPGTFANRPQSRQAYPGLCFFGMRFEPPDERTSLVLYALIQENLARELDVASSVFDLQD